MKDLLNKLIPGILLIAISLGIKLIFGLNMSIDRQLLIYVSIFAIVYFLSDCCRLWKEYKNRSYVQLRKEFEDKRIAEKITRVCQWKRKYPSKGEYKKQHNDPEAYPGFLLIHNDRRDVTEYYQKVEKYLDKVLITSDEFILLIPKNRAKILLEIIEPIEKEIEEITGEKPDLSVFRTIENIQRFKNKKN